MKSLTITFIAMAALALIGPLQAAGDQQATGTIQPLAVQAQSPENLELMQKISTAMPGEIDQNGVDYVIVVKKDGDWTVYSGDTEKEWKKAQLSEFQQKDKNLVHAEIRKVLVEYKVNPTLVCNGNYCVYR